jgi:Flp pilus assembly protein protease CpaA
MIEKYIFLFGLAFVWMVFAVIQDLRTREISNWLNFSLIAIVLAYRALYSLDVGQWDFFLYGLGGVILFVFFGYLFYYSKVFAGGDAKLLFGLGGVLPFESLKDYLFLGGGFILLLFSVGVIYTLFYSCFLVWKRFEEFKKDFSKRFLKLRILFFISLILVLAIFFYVGVVDLGLTGVLGLMILPIIFILYIYVKSVEGVCMIKNVNPKNLTEGDWLEKDVRIGKKWIKKSVHGLSMKEIILLRRKGKKVLIKDGVPFSPAFLIAFLIFIYMFFKGFYVLI